jgi:hypothetical protein
VDLFGLSPTLLQTQRLFRARYDGPEGEGGFRLTLRLAAADRYQARAVDALGRGVWSLDATSEGSLWLDLRKKVYCRFEGPLDLEGTPLSPLPVAGFPALLLGRLPVPAASPPRRVEDELRFEDGSGRQWRVRSEAGAIVGWTLYEGGEPVAWWSLGREEAVLSDRRQGVQLRWRQVVAEPLAGDLAPLEVPEGFTRVACEEAALELPRDDS